MAEWIAEDDWTPIPESSELRNPDWLPDWLVRKDGCDKCGAAFVEIDGLFLGVTTLNDTVTVASPNFVYVGGTQRVIGARYVCTEEHRTDHTPRDPMTTILIAGGVLGGILSMALGAYMYGHRQRK